MIKGFKDKLILLRAVMTEDEMELYLLKNGYDLGEGICKKGQEHLYIADSTEVVEFAMALGYEAKMNEEEENVFTNHKMVNSTKKCKKCNAQVEIEKEIDYPYYCVSCEENFYEFETNELN